MCSFSVLVMLMAAFDVAEGMGMRFILGKRLKDFFALVNPAVCLGACARN